MTGLVIAGVVALVAMFVLLVLGGYRSRLLSEGGVGRGDETMSQRGRWYNVRAPIKQSVLTDTHGDLVHQDGSTTATQAERDRTTAASVKKGPNDSLI